MKRPDAPPPPPTPPAVQRSEPIRCEVPEAPIIAQAMAANASDAAVEEYALASVAAQIAARNEALWQCIRRHNERVKQ